MQASEPVSGVHSELYKATIDEALASSGPLMGRLVAAVVRMFYSRELTARTVHERDSLIVASKLLQSKEADLRALFTKSLRAAIEAPQEVKKGNQLNMAEMHFDQLELMDENQVIASVVMARAQQTILLAAEAALTELTALICSTLGLKTVRPDSNPLRTQVYVTALQNTVELVGVPEGARREWMGAMSEALGPELRQLYAMWTEQLRRQGVEAAAYVVLPKFVDANAGVGRPGSVAADNLRSDLAKAPLPATGATPRPIQSLSSVAGQLPGLPELPPVPAGPMAQAQQPNSTVDTEKLLTLDKLRRLLAGELDTPVAGNRIEDFARQFAREFEGDANQPLPPITDFDGTVPAALEALTEMKQVDRMVNALQKRRGQTQSVDGLGGASVGAVRQALREQASGLAQVLSLEVVTLMVDNMARNAQLLEPVQALIASLEPALLRLALVDPRFFTDKQHPARALLQELTHRSIAYESSSVAGFPEFLEQLKQAVVPLNALRIDDAEPFEAALQQLRGVWMRSAQQKEQARAESVRVLQHAEQRNLLAEKIARKIEAHPDSASVPEVVIEFLCGPWAQVVAQARIVGGDAAGSADKYQALISAMLWSAHPELARKNIGKLTRLVPLLLSTVREGLETIRYPATKTGAFLEALMGLHQLAFSATAASNKVPESTQANDVPLPVLPRVSNLSRLVEEGDPWIAPEEAKTSNFMELPDLLKTSAQTAPSVLATQIPISEELVDALPLGSWVELLSDDKWVRTQLTWASPHGTLFLFTSALGNSQSMTRRSRDKLLAAGSLRIVTGQTVVDGALDAVAQIAMRNSVDTTY
ncbi:DUF1631 family protein [Rhodoferax aquaticus]|uniref:DUF1631 family protein n=1 Tax=Rhodoferax aquaticus TaxID=2527691 RepID=A0A515ER38_9BURK|nr:DUF1631 family protein [Rhodoferax aquaticus]QDL55137.1 DUF1631 family protein [Rhodoferax aquaticus]